MQRIKRLRHPAAFNQPEAKAGKTARRPAIARRPAQATPPPAARAAPRRTRAPDAPTFPYRQASRAARRFCQSAPHLRCAEARVALEIGRGREINFFRPEHARLPFDAGDHCAECIALRLRQARDARSRQRSRPARFPPDRPCRAVWQTTRSRRSRSVQDRLRANRRRRRPAGRRSRRCRRRPRS